MTTFYVTHYIVHDYIPHVCADYRGRVRALSTRDLPDLQTSLRWLRARESPHRNGKSEATIRPLQFDATNKDDIENHKSLLQFDATNKDEIENHKPQLAGQELVVDIIFDDGGRRDAAERLRPVQRQHLRLTAASDNPT